MARSSSARRTASSTASGRGTDTNVNLDRLPSDTVLIVGAGLAGLYCALRLERPSVVVTTEARGGGGSSIWAQGGIAAALAPGDTPEAHADDTVAAGVGLADPDAVLAMTREGPSHVAALADLGVPFDVDDSGAFTLSLEAAHRCPRVAHVGGDLAGREIMKAVGNAALKRPRVQLCHGYDVRSLLVGEDGRVGGVLARDRDDRVVPIRATDVVLATGGVGRLYNVTTNPATAVGDAIAMAARAKSTIADPEFVQFHPTAIDIGLDPAPLATEALRGEGARLVDRDGRALSGDAGINLAPRDVVARAVHRAVLEGRGAFLDATTALGGDFPTRFPTVFAACEAAGVDPRTQPIPVAPAAHYHMGGVATDLFGRADVPGLWVLGEAASTGVHGANRLASNSLLEATVFAARAAGALDGRSAVAATAMVSTAPPPELPATAQSSLRQAMSRHAGVERDATGLAILIGTIDSLEQTHGASNPLLAARLIAAAAWLRTESRGAHYRVDGRSSTHLAQRTMISLAQARDVLA